MAEPQTEDNGDGRIAKAVSAAERLARIEAKIDLVLQSQEVSRQDRLTLHRDGETLDTRVQCIERDFARMQERMSMIAAFQATFAVIAAAVAGVLAALFGK
jgi:low affinity Fe/Cu permease